MHYLRLRSTKAGKIQRQPMPRWVEKVVKKLVKQRLKETNGDQNAPLFVSYYRPKTNQRPMSIRTIRRKFRFYCKLVGIDAAPHSARAAFATRLLRQGHPYEQVSAALRHRTTLMVETYDHRSFDELAACGSGIEY